MREYQSLSHTRWDCKYPVVFVPKGRKRKIVGSLRQHLGAIFHERVAHEGSRIMERHLMPDQVPMCLSVPPRCAVSSVVGYLKGKSAIPIARRFGGRERDFAGEVFWARGYFVSAVGLDEAVVRASIGQQEQADELHDRMRLGGYSRLGRLTVLSAPLMRSPNEPLALPGVI